MDSVAKRFRAENGGWVPHRHVTNEVRETSQYSSFSGGKPKPCMKFFSTSGCPFGEACHFLHYVPGGLSALGLSPLASLPAPGAYPTQKKPVGPVGDPSVTVNGYKTKLCNRYNTAEGCRFGDKCHFAHGENDLRPSSNHSQGSNLHIPTNGPRELAPPGFGDNCSPIHSNPVAHGSASNVKLQGYAELSPPGVAANVDPSNCSPRSVGTNVQVQLSRHEVRTEELPNNEALYFQLPWGHCFPCKTLVKWKTTRKSSSMQIWKR